MKKTKKKVLLSFDVEEFDLPREHGAEISLEDGIKISSTGLRKILKILDKQKVKATFFTTGNFAKGNPSLVEKILREGHELAAHGVDHFQPKDSDLAEAKAILQKGRKLKIQGYRVPRMMKIDYEELKRLGYGYDSSVNPAFIPGRYNHFNVPRKPFVRDGILEIPTSVATGLRIPMFWLALHIFPTALYIKLAKKSLQETEYFATYFHPWEFADILKIKAVPFYIKKNSGKKLCERLSKVITELKAEDVEFTTYGEFAKKFIQ